MKKLFLLLLAVGSWQLVAMAQGNKSTIKAKFDGLTTDTIIVQTSYTRTPDVSKSDTIVMKKDGWYEMSVADDYAVDIIFGEMPKAGSRGWTMSDITRLTVFPGESITVTGGIKDKAEIKGSAYADEMKKYEALTKECDDELNKLVEERTARLKAEGEANEEKIFEEYSPKVKDILKKKTDVTLEYVKTHPDSPVAVTYACYDMTDGDNMMQYISEKAKNGPMKYFIEQMKKYKEESDARKAKAEALKKAEVAQDFTLKDINGNDLTLSSLYNKGKFIVLDFWGSWCHWCLKAAPKLKAVYEAHKNKMQVLSVDCHDTVEKWKKAVEEHQLNWLNVKDEEKGGVAEKYGIQGYPTFIVISPEGKILKVQEGTEDEFYTWLEETVKG